jgi:cell division septal protein FtsQ
LIKLIKRFFIFIIIIFLLIFYLKKEYISSKFKSLIDSYLTYSGMVLNEVYVNKRKESNVNNDNIIEVLNIDIGDTINSFNINNIRKRINDLSWVKESKIYLLPLGKLDIFLIEHIPFGVLELNKNHYLIDNNGIRIKAIESFEFPSLFRLYGEGATLDIKELPPIIQKLKKLNFEVLKIERIDLRRWNIFTKKGFYLKLPNLNPINSIEFLYPLNNIDYNNLDFIDLRIENRISLKYNKN